ncbi:MAG: sulfatase [Lentisphaerales bacterium]|nr:sulfatase [Lentisphaerales bacterium]
MKHFILISTMLLQSLVAADRPNILWFVVEDMSSHFAYNGEKSVNTPHVDRLAREGTIFSNAYVTAPVCSTSRSAMITGMYQTTIGAHHHRSSQGEEKIHLPKHVKTVPELFKEAGYYTCNGSAEGKVGKRDYNFVHDYKKMYDGADWSGKKVGQPFFAQVQLKGGKRRNQVKKDIIKKLYDPVKVGYFELPPYYAPIKEVEEDWAAYLNTVQFVDLQVGKILERLEKENELDNTLIIFMTDHGVSHVRGKQFCYDEGAKVPFIVWAPKKIKAALRDELILHIDMAATSLHFAGIDIPDYMQARTLFGKQAKEREYIVSARDRCDETVDRIRGVRKGSFKYIRNFYPERPYLQPCAYKDAKVFMQPLKDYYAAGKMNSIQALAFQSTRPAEELYELNNDQWEIKNLAGDKAYEDKLVEMRELLNKWVKESHDLGQSPESEAMFNSDMKVYVDKIKKNAPARAKIIEDNIAQMKKWAKEGK